MLEFDETLVYPVDERLKDPGDTYTVKGRLALDAYELGGHDFTVEDGLSFDLALTNAGEGILATGLVSAAVVGECDRCLEPAHLPITGEVDEYFLFREPTGQEKVPDEDGELDFSLVSDDHTIDLSDAVRDALLLETPYVVLCREDCKGLCPVCGKNLNDGPCGHEDEVDRMRLSSNPFAALKDLMDQGGEER